MNVNDSVSTELLRDLHRTMVTARRMDEIEQSYTARGEAFFHVSGAGHEGSVALAPHLTEADWLHCHYRDKALMLHRGITPEMFFMALFNKDGAHSRGRQMNAHMSAPDLKVLSIVGPVGNSALQAAGVAAQVRDGAGQPIVLCALGEGMTQEGEVIEAIGHTVRDTLPVLFVIQDNAFAISTRTRGRTFYSYPEGEADAFYGVPITRIDGRDPVAAVGAFGAVVGRMRETGRPAIVVFSVERLHNHTNADDQRMYRTAEEIAHAAATGDPIARMERELVARGVPAEELASDERAIIDGLTATARRVQRSAEPVAIHTAAPELPAHLSDPAREYRGDGSADVVMLEAIRETLDARMAADDRVVLFGEDIEDPKGDVFGVTRGLTGKYGERVRNSPLSESLIVGVSIGRALAGARPVAFLQFADFLPIAYNQIFAELGSMWWRTDGGWRVPVIVMVTAGGYRPGLGPFHASTLEAIVAHTPGIDVFMPSSAADAAGLLNAAFESERPTVFFYPKNQLNDRATATSRDVARQIVPIGRARHVRRGDAATVVAWGNTVPLAVRAADALAAAGHAIDVVDLRSLVPWDVEAVVASAERTGRLVVAHEDNHTAGFGAEVIATVAERARRRIDARRVTRGDTYVPCNFANQLEVLPSFQRILETTVELMGGSVVWTRGPAAVAGMVDVPAVGSSPSDETVSIVTWHVAAGDSIAAGALLADVEADKAAAELQSPVGGTIAELLVAEGDAVPVGTPVARVVTGADEADYAKPLTREDPGEPTLIGLGDGGAAHRRGDPGPGARPSTAATPTPGAGRPGGDATLHIVAVATRTGSRLVPNAELATMTDAWDAASIAKRTGIEQRYWVTGDENALSLAVDAAREVMERTAIDVADLDAIIFATGTPTNTTPSMAALVQYALAGERAATGAAYDINAACAGYIYGLRLAWDHLAGTPSGTILLVTSEVLSPRLDLADEGTGPIFGDAATATLLCGPAAAAAAHALAVVDRPVLAAKGESGGALAVPVNASLPVTMDGPTVYLEAVRAMMGVLGEAAEAAGLRPDALDLYVPHQANQRIINAIRQRMKLPEERVYSNIARFGNTSSNTIPLCLAELLPEAEANRTWGLTAFGGGFTYGGAVIRTTGRR